MRTWKLQGMVMALMAVGAMAADKFALGAALTVAGGALMAVGAMAADKAVPTKEKEPVTLDVVATEKWLEEHPKAVVLDVRTKAEYDEGCLKGAKLIPITDKDFLEKVKKEIQPDQPVLVYCRVGGRSAQAVKVLQDAGYVDLKELGGGVIAWRKAEKPLVK